MKKGTRDEQTLWPEWHYLINDRVWAIVQKKAQSIMGWTSGIFADGEALRKEASLKLLSRNQIVNLARELARVAQIAIPPTAGRVKKGGSESGQSPEVDEDDPAYRKAMDFCRSRYELAAAEAFRTCPLERGYSYIWANLLESASLGEGVRAHIVEEWVFVPHLFGEPGCEPGDVAQSLSICVYLMPDDREWKNEWMGFRWMLDKQKGIPFPVPPPGVPPAQWTDEQLALGYLLWSQLVLNPHQHAKPYHPNIILSVILWGPQQLFLKPFDLSRRRAIRTFGRKLFPPPSRNAISIDRGIWQQHIVGQLSLVALRQEVAGQDTYEELVCYAARGIGGKEAGLYARDAIENAIENWLYPVRPTSLYGYLRRVGRGMRAHDIEKRRRDVAPSEDAEDNEGERPPRPPGREEMVFEEHDEDLRDRLRDPRHPSAQQWFTIPEAAEFIGMSKETLHYKIRKGEITPAAPHPLMLSLEQVKQVQLERSQWDIRCALVHHVAEKHGLRRNTALKRVKRKLDEGYSIEEAAKMLLQ